MEIFAVKICNQTLGLFKIRLLASTGTETGLRGKATGN
jgi:hypothetical protein